MVKLKISLVLKSMLRFRFELKDTFPRLCTYYTVDESILVNASEIGDKNMYGYFLLNLL